MRKFFILLCGVFFMGNAQKSHAQVKDVTFTISPVAEYTWWNSNLNLTNSPFWGIRAGFGLGRLVELRGTYERSINMKSNLANTDWKFLPALAPNATETKVDMSRWGGEFKLNLWSGTTVTSYLLAGTGVMHLKYKEIKDLNGTAYKEDDLYGSLGLGLKFNISPRVVLSLEARDLMFKPNENKPYLKAGVDNKKLMHNATALASLDFYLGGYNDQSKDAVTNAYRKVFAGGFKGMKFVIEPTLSYWKFDNGSSFRDQVFEGVSAGVDFTSLFGIRGFYAQATKKNNQPDFEFNKNLKMYGGNFIARLNNSRGVNPYLTFGGGYLNVNSAKYVPKAGKNKAESGWFLMGGAGLEIPFSKYVALFGSVNAMIMEQQNDIDKITNPSSLNIGMMYQTGLRFNIGASTKKGYNVYQNYVSQAVADQHQADMNELNQMRAEYNKKIKDLDVQLQNAVAQRDTVQVTKIVVKRQQLDAANEKIDSLEQYINNMKMQEMARNTKAQAQSQPMMVAPVAEYKAPVINVPSEQNGEKMVRLTKAELVDMVTRAIEQANNKPVVKEYNNGSNEYANLERIILLNALTRSINNGNPLPYGTATPNNFQTEQSANQQQITNQKNEEIINKLDRVIDKLNNTISQQKAEARMAKTIASVNNANVQAAVAAAFNNAPTTVAMPVEGTTATTLAGTEPTKTRFLKMNRFSVFTGANFGAIWNWNIGIRTNMQVSNTNLDFMPEFYVGLGSKNGFGLSANVVYNIDIKSLPVVPYAGLGIGVFNADGNTRFGPNIIVGASMKMTSAGSIFADYSSRNLFKNNQIAVGYRFVF